MKLAWAQLGLRIAGDSKVQPRLRTVVIHISWTSDQYISLPEILATELTHIAGKILKECFSFASN